MLDRVVQQLSFNPAQVTHWARNLSKINTLVAVKMFYEGSSGGNATLRSSLPVAVA